MNLRKKRRRSTSATIYIPIAALLVLLLTIYGSSAFLKIINIEVIGSTRYSRAEIVAATGITVGDNMILVDTLGAKVRVYTELPFISVVEITRSMPDTILIEVRESEPIAFVGYKNGAAMIDSSGKVLYFSDNAPPGLIEIRGVRPTDAVAGSIIKAGTENETKLSYMIQVLAAIDKAEIKKDVTYLDITSIANIGIDYKERRVLLGGPEDVQKKLDELPAKMDEIIGTYPDDKQGVFDMSRKPWRWAPDR